QMPDHVPTPDNVTGLVVGIFHHDQNLKKDRPRRVSGGGFSKLRLGNRDLKADRRDYRPSERKVLVVRREGLAHRRGRRRSLTALLAARARPGRRAALGTAVAEQDHLLHDDRRVEALLVALLAVVAVLD